MLGWCWHLPRLVLALNRDDTSHFLEVGTLVLCEINDLDTCQRCRHVADNEAAGV